MNTVEIGYMIQQAFENDLIDILDLQQKVFSVVAKQMNKFDIPPLLQTLQDICNENKKALILKYVSNDKIVGSVRGYVDENNICHIGKLIVHPKYQNKGIGKALMYEIEKRFILCDKYTLFTGVDTPNTLHLYSKIGYNIIDKRMVDNIMMIIMEKENIFIGKKI